MIGFRWCTAMRGIAMKPKYGKAHKDWAKRLPNPTGMPCPRCGLAMWPLQQYLELGHVVAVAQGGSDGPRQWEHRSCNRRAGAKLGNARRPNALPHTTTQAYIDGDQHSESW